MKKVAVVILNWNGAKFLEKFLPNVLQYSSDYADIIVADNASTDNSVEFLKTNFPEVQIIQNKSNGGFAKGYNDALFQLEHPYFVLLNSDIEVSENWIQPIIELMETDKKIAACQPKILSYNEPEKFEYAGGAGGFIDKYGYPFCRGRIFNHLETDNGQYDDNTEIFWATGACMFVRSEVYKQIGGLDNDFFAHMEEIDICWRMKNLGYKIMYCAQSKVFHVGGGTLPKKSSMKTFLNFRNNFFLLFKNLPSNKLAIVIIPRLFLDGGAAIKFLVEGDFKDVWAVARAHFAFYFSFTKSRKKRKSLPKQTTVSCIYQGNIVVEHYLNHKKLFSKLNSTKFSK
ncbi:MAG: glycosyltransferase family 2 protein [Bacteroidetes bacterium]|nr:glycosyltransferase family 2 protein [Bacteroidota bacterium]